MIQLLQDLKFSLRSFRKQLAFTLVVVATLALGIGLTTTVWSVVDTVLLRSLPFPHADRLLMVWATSKQQGYDHYEISPPDFLDFQRQARTLADAAAFEKTGFDLTGEGTPERLKVAQVSPNLFRVLAVRPALGRGFQPGEDQKGSAPVAVLADGFWRRRFGGSPAMVGKMLTLNGARYQVVGVLPQHAAFPADVDLFVPKVFRPVELTDRGRGLRYLRSVARLKPGVSLAQAQLELGAIAARLEQLNPKNNKGWGVRLVALQEQVVGGVRPLLLVLLGAVAFVLAMICINIANLLLARMLVRQREMSIRTALGAGRGRLARQLLTETLLLVAMGGALGCLLTLWLERLLQAASPAGIPRLDELRPDAAVLGAALLLTAVAGVLLVLVPLHQVSRMRIAASLKEREASSQLGRSIGRSALVATQVGVAVLLLIGAGLMIRTLAKLQAVDPGFQAGRLTTVAFALPDSTDPEKVLSFVQGVEAGLRGLGGVESEAAVTTLPLSGAEPIDMEYSVPEVPSTKAGDPVEAGFDAVTSRYFRTMGIPLVAGRSFTDADRGDGAPVAMINRAMAKLYWPDGQATGKHIQLAMPGEKPRDIVGVVGDVRHASLDLQPKPAIYVPYEQMPIPFVNFVLRSPRTAADLAPAIRQVVSGVDRNRPVVRIETMDDLIAGSLATRRFAMLLLCGFGVVAFLLALVGVYGVMSFYVNQRVREMGIRIALGAERTSVVRLIVTRGLQLTVAGLAVGIVASLAGGRLLQSLVFGVGVFDAPTVVAAVGLLLLMMLAATVVPAVRAAQVDPLSVMREE